MSDRRAVLGAIVLALFSISTLSGCGGASAAYSTPQATFDTAKAAVAKEDWKGFAQCLTPDSRDTMAGAMVMAGSMMQAFAGLGGDEGKKEAKDVEAVLKKHGIDEKSLEGPPLGDAKTDPNEAMKKLSSSIKDRDAFIGEIMTVMSKSGKMKDKGPMTKDATLKDVKVDGDTASGTIATKADGKDVNEPIKFRKISGAWKMEIDMDRKGGGPPPGGIGDPAGADPLKIDDLPKTDQPKAEEPPKTDEPPKTGDPPKSADEAKPGDK
jgi:hypothetical protein